MTQSHRRPHAYLAKRLLRWYKRNGRKLPWRRTRNPYRILISEIMLQQTQVSRVVLKYPEFLRRFPTITALAGAPLREVITAWRGMGYNNRAVRLHRLARALVERTDGKIPRDVDSLMKLPGIGRYTANALLSSAFRMSLPVVDVNIRRVLSRLRWRMKTTTDMRPENNIWEFAATLLPRGRAYDWNQALMDLGATICTARAPRCHACPAALSCVSRNTMNHTRHRTLRPEPSRNGIPNRIYRGKVIERLRGRRYARIRTLSAEVNIGRQDGDWFASLIRGLARDGLVQIRGTGTSLRVSLA